ncbi:hypothetical protein TNCT_253701, partial [Trichonephila clavata]
CQHFLVKWWEVTNPTAKKMETTKRFNAAGVQALVGAWMKMEKETTEPWSLVHHLK